MADLEVGWRNGIVMTAADIQAKSESWNMRVIGHHDLNGHGDGMQLLKQGRYVYLAHLGTSPMALSIIDVADPADPRVVTQIPHAPNTHSHKVQIAGDILIQNQERPYFTDPFPPACSMRRALKFTASKSPPNRARSAS
jgi:hypothetical protein